MNSAWLLEMSSKRAYISRCELYRYNLSRVWDRSKPQFLYIGINPSTADATFDDQTVKKWAGFTAANGGGGFTAVNVFAYRSTDVSKLAEVENPVGVRNHIMVEKYIKDAHTVIPCWGRLDKVPRELRHNFTAVNRLIFENKSKPLCFGYNADGTPKHPQMLGYKTPLIPYEAIY